MKSIVKILEERRQKEEERKAREERELEFQRKAVVKILEEKEEERKAREERELEFQRKAVELVRKTLREEGYDPEDVTLISYRPILYGDRVDVSVHLSPVGYRLSPLRTVEPSIFCRFFESGEAQLEYVAEAIEDLVNPFYWEKEPELPTFEEGGQ